MNIQSSDSHLVRLAAIRGTNAIRRRSRRGILLKTIAPISICLTCLGSVSAWADAIFAPGDLILGGQEDIGTLLFQIGIVGTTANTNNWPAGEAPERAIDGFAGKYLNFGQTYTGILVNPAFNGGNGSVVSSLQLWTANDSEPRDPASYELWGTNATLDFGATTFDMSLFTQVSFGALALPGGRSGTGTAALNNANSQTVTFANSAAYKSYLLVFPTIKNSANSMQIGEVQLFGIAAFTSLKWAGNASAIWNISGAQNWTVSGSPSTYSDTNGVTFDDTGSATNNNITIQTTGGVGVKPAAVIFENNTQNYTISGDKIESTGNLAINGRGSVTLNNANSYAAGVAVNAGTLNVGTTGNLGGANLAINNANIGDGTAVTVNFNSAQTIGSLSGAIATPASGVNSATINLKGTLTINQSVDASYAGSIAGTGGLTKNGSGSLTLTGVNTYAGATVINAGMLRSAAPGDNPQGALPAGQPVTVNNGAVLAFDADDGAGYYEGSVSSITLNGSTVLAAKGTHSTLPALTLNGGSLSSGGTGNFSNDAVVNYILDGSVTTVASSTISKIDASTIMLRGKTGEASASAPVTFTVPRGTTPVDLAISSEIVDKGAGLVKAGNGILALTNANSYTGPTVINGGTVAVVNSSALGTGAVTINTGGTLALGAATTIGFENFSLNGGATVDSTARVLSLTENVGNLTRSVFSQTQFSISNGFTTSFVYTAGGNRAADGFTFTIQNSSPTALGGGGGALGYTGIGNSAAVQFNIYTGNGQLVGTNFGVGSVGPYTASAPVNLASGNSILVTLTYDPVAQTITETLLDQSTRATYTNVFSNVDLATALGGDSGYIGFTGATGGAIASQSIDNFSFTNFTEGVSIANDVAIAAGATSTLDVLPLSAGGVGAATLRGTLDLGANATLNITGGAITTNSAYSLRVTGTTRLIGSTTVNVANNGTGGGLLELGAVTGLSPNAALIKMGDGTLKLTGTSSYTGQTTVMAGTLLVNAALSGSMTAVNNGATLGGTGSLSNVMVGAGGTLAPGEGIGTLATGPLLLQDGSMLRLEIGEAAADQVKVTGAGTLTGVINLVLSLVGDPVDGLTYTILDGSASLVGYAGGARFSYLGTPLVQDQAFTVTSGGFTQAFTISYTGDAGRDVTLVAVPEPGVGASLLIGLAGFLGLRRRRGSSNCNAGRPS